MFDFHTHTIMDGNTPCLLNIPFPYKNYSTEAYSQNPNIAFSVGLHPWDVSEKWEENVEAVRNEATQSRVWAIGECGLDKILGASFDLQLKAFRAQIAVSEDVRKPMVIHCVKAFNELLAVRKELYTENQRLGRQTMPWVIHGFRGKPDLAKQLMTKGLFLSFGNSYNIETLRQVFVSNHFFFLETDDNHLPISHIYEQVSHHLGVGISHLETICDPRQTIFSDFHCDRCLP